MLALTLCIACVSDSEQPASAGFLEELTTLCDGLATSIEGRTDDDGVLQEVADFSQQLENLDPPEELASGFEEFSSAIESSVVASQDQLEATEAQQLEDALMARAEAAEAKMDIYLAVDEHSLPESCKGDTLDTLEASLFAGRADLICFDFAEEFLSMLQSVQGESLTGEFLEEESVPRWRAFTKQLRGITPEGQAQPAAMQMVDAYHTGAEALLDIATALKRRDEQLGKAAQRDYYSAIERADRIAESFGITQCSKILGLGQAQ